MIKKILILSALCFVFFSCKKDYTCSCINTQVTTAYTEYGEHHPQSTETTTTKYQYREKEDKAKSICKSYEKVEAYTIGSGEAQHTFTVTVSCDFY